MNAAVRACLVLVVMGSLTAPVVAHAQETPPDVQLIEVRRLLQELDYERALSMLDQLVPRLDRATDDSSRGLLIAAVALRGQTNFQLGSQQGASDDLARVLSIDPAYMLPPAVSPRLVSLFEEIRKTRVGTVTLVANPDDAAIQIDGRTVLPGPPIALVAGDHQVTAARPGYRALSETFSVTGGTVQTVNVVLVRVSAAVTMITSPPGVEIVLNGVTRGSSVAGPLTIDYADLPARLRVAAADIASPMVLDDLAPGSYSLMFRRACYQNELRTLNIDTPRDIRLEPIVLKPAVSSLRVESSDPEARVFIDGQPRGTAPLDVPDLCEGEHTVELRSPAGRYFERVNAVRDGALRVAGVVKPAFAVVSVSGLPANYRGQDLRLDLERALRSAARVTFIAPPMDVVKPTLAAEQLADDSLSFDLAKRPLGAAARMTPQVRRTVVQKVSNALDMQGVATITVVGGETAMQRMAVSLFAAGASEPDVILVDLQEPGTIARALDTIDYAPSFSTPSLGMLGIEATDVEGIVIARVDPGGPAATAGLQVGERLIQVFDQTLKSEADLIRVLEQRRGAESLPAFVVDRQGTRRDVTLKAAPALRLASVFDQTLPFNALAVQWRARTRRTDDPEAALVRLHLAVAAYRMGDFETARTELEKTDLPDGPGISQGTVQYLLGLAYEGLSDIGRARQAWTRAASAESATLSEQGGRIAELAKQKLSTLR